MHKILIRLTITISFLVVNMPIFSDVPKIEINCANPIFKQSEPLVLELIFTYGEPQLSVRGNVPFPTIKHNAVLYISDPNVQESFRKIPLIPFSLEKNDANGYIYTNTFIIFYEGKETNKFIFSEKGKYTLKVNASPNIWSNSIQITVLPASGKELEAMASLSPWDYVFLFIEDPLPEQSKLKEIENQVMVRYDDLIRKYPDIYLAKWAAARLGLMTSYEIKEKYKSLEKLNLSLKDKEVDEPLVQKSYENLLIATGLPDGFPMKEKILSELSTIYYIKNDYDKAIELQGEIEKKYPFGRYGQLAKTKKQKLIELKSKGTR